MKTYLLSAAGVIFLSVIVSLLLPEGKLHKTVNFVMRLICIFVLVRPVTGIFKIPSAQTETSFTDYDYVCEQYSEHQSLQLCGLLKEKFSLNAECIVEVGYEDGRFAVDKVEVALLKEDENNIEEIRSYLQELGYINISVYAKST